MTPVRIQLTRAKGWRMPKNTVKVDRSTRWGNPFVVGTPGIPDAAASARVFRIFVVEEGGSAHMNRHHIAAMLRGKNLACWCNPGEACHADVLLELANK